MAIKTAAVTVGTNPTRLDVYADNDQGSGFSLLVVNEGAASIRVGGPDVAMTGATRGALVGAGLDLSIDVGKGNPIYAVCASGTVDVTVAQVGV